MSHMSAHRFDSIDIWCDECGAQFRNDCHCPETLALPQPEAQDKWVGIDGHHYVGDASNKSSAYHDEAACPCRTSEDF